MAIAISQSISQTQTQTQTVSSVQSMAVASEISVTQAIAIAAQVAFADDRLGDDGCMVAQSQTKTSIVPAIAVSVESSVVPDS